ncbi:MAG: hypothetical protein Q7J10_02925 [Methanosarcinaceae archaeon]|nr:hypothetical protein [Methanosarcinaceae archaeon]
MSDIKEKAGNPGATGKDKFLIVSIHQMVEESGWKGIETNFGVESHHMIYVKRDSPLDKIEVKAHVMGNHLDVTFLGVAPKKGLLDKVFDFNIQEVPKTFEFAKYVTDDINILNEQRLRNTIAVVIKELEESAKK